jgi:hypothetical protein
VRGRKADAYAANFDLSTSGKSRKSFEQVKERLA